MPVPGPPKPDDTIGRKATKWSVFLGDDAGNFPDRNSDEAEWLNVTEVRLGSTAQRLDTIICKMNLQKAEERLTDTTILVGYNRIIEIRKLGEKPEGSEDLIIAWGHIVKIREKINNEEESLEIVARLDHNLIGGLLQFYHVRDEVYSRIVQVNDHIVFNPVIDDKVEGNLSDYRENGLPVFIDPESLRSDEAKILQSQESEKWFLHEAVFYICKHLLGVRNLGDIEIPKEEDIADVLADFDDHLFKDIQIRLGSNLPSALDQLLIRFGYSWHLATRLDQNGIKDTTLEFFKLGEGDEIDIYMARPGESIDNINTNVSNFSIEYSTADLTNQILGYSKLILREGTFKLDKGWPDEIDDPDNVEEKIQLDDISLAELKRENLDKKPYLRDVGRKYVLNEAGDYNFTRPEIITHMDLTELLGPHVVKRRVFEKPISYKSAEQIDHNLITVEWLNPETEVFEPVKWSFSILQKECGIYFEGDTPPKELWDLINNDPADVEIKITASIRGDSRTWGQADKQVQSPNNQIIESILDLSTEYDDRDISDAGTYQSKFYQDPADVIEPLDDINKHCVYTRDTDDAAQVSTSNILDGIDHLEYKRGMVIGKASGRNLILNAKHPDFPETQKLQIIGINYTLQKEQKTELLLERFEGEQI